MIPKLNKIYCRDSLLALKEIESESIDLIFTDPIFAINHKKLVGNYNRNAELVLDGYKEVKVKDYLDFSRKWIKESHRVLKKAGSICIVSGWSNQKDILIALDEFKFHLKNELIWKYNFGLFTTRRWVSSHYDIFFATKHKSKFTFNKLEHYPQDVFNLLTKSKVNSYIKAIKSALKEKDIDEAKKIVKNLETDVKNNDFIAYEPKENLDILPINREYWRGEIKTPNKLPLLLCKLIVQYLSNEGDIILDAFVGTGTIPLAALQLNRQFIGFEIVPEYCELAKKRLKQDKKM